MSHLSMSIPEPRKILTAFRCQGLSLQQGVIPLIQAHLRKQHRLHLKQQRSSSPSSTSSDASPSAALPQQLLTDLVSKVKLSLMERGSGSVVDPDLLQLAISSIHSRTNVQRADLIQHLSALTMPRFYFDSHHRTFLPLPTSPPLCSPVPHQSLLFTHRYDLIHQRVLSNPLFSSSTSSFTLSTLDTLHGTSYKHNLLAMITLAADQRYHLEDATASIPITWGADFVYGDGYFMEGSIVLAEGRMDDTTDTLTLDTIMMPPVERRKDTLVRHKELRMIEEEEEVEVKDRGASMDVDAVGERRGSVGAVIGESDMVLVMSEVWLDQAAVIARLHAVFSAFDEGHAPAVMVLAGPFLSSSTSSTSSSSLSTHLDLLAELIASYPRLNAAAHFVLVPSSSDTPFGPVLPYPPMLSSSHQLMSKVKKLTLATNPYHLIYHTRHLIFYQHNSLALMQRHALLTPSTAAATTRSTKSVSSEHRHYLHSLLSQSHLSPFTLDTQPVYWQYDAALSLYPLPHVLFLLDSCAPFEVDTDGCLCVNPGSLGKDGSFAVYYPASGKVEPSKTP